MSIYIAAVILGCVVIMCAFYLFYITKKYQYLLREHTTCLKAYGCSQETIDALQKKVVIESKQAVLYRERALEVEDAVKEGVGVTLRNEITKVECIFDATELASMLAGARFLIKEEYKSTSAIKYYLALIEKIEKAISAMVKAEEEKNNPKT